MATNVTRQGSCSGQLLQLIDPLSFDNVEQVRRVNTQAGSFPVDPGPLDGTRNVHLTYINVMVCLEVAANVGSNSEPHFLALQTMPVFGPVALALLLLATSILGRGFFRHLGSNPSNPDPV